jgi:hypothetical protein
MPRGAVYTDTAKGEFAASPLLPCCPSALHVALKADPALWAAAPYVGIQDGAGGPDLELRNCPACATTLANELWPDDDTPTPERTT